MLNVPFCMQYWQADYSWLLHLVSGLLRWALGISGISWTSLMTRSWTILLAFSSPAEAAVWATSLLSSQHLVMKSCESKRFWIGRFANFMQQARNPGPRTKDDKRTLKVEGQRTTGMFSVSIQILILKHCCFPRSQLSMLRSRMLPQELQSPPMERPAQVLTDLTIASKICPGMPPSRSILEPRMSL